jgi:hypothetical protein
MSLSNREKIQLAIEKLNAMTDHHPSMIFYSEAKVLYNAVPAIVSLLESTLEVLEDDGEEAEKYAEVQIALAIIGNQD